jgi:hypothetical protein
MLPELKKAGFGGGQGVSQRIFASHFNLSFQRKEENLFIVLSFKLFWKENAV